MEPLNDKELNQLLRQWEAPSAPSSLRVPANAIRPSRWQWLWNGRIQIPVPLGAAAMIIAAAVWMHSVKATHNPVLPAAGTAASPVSAPTAPLPPVVAPTNETPLPTGTHQNESASIAGFRAVDQLEPRVVAVRP